MKKPKLDIPAQLKKLARAPRATPMAEEPEENWEVQSANVVEVTTVNPTQTSVTQTALLVSVTYVNTDTGETMTGPVGGATVPDA